MAQEHLLNQHPELLNALDPKSADLLRSLADSLAHLRERRGRQILFQAQKFLKETDLELDESSLAEFADLCALNWALALPYLQSLPALGRDSSLRSSWVELACQLAQIDVDTGIIFLNETSAALQNLDSAQLLYWGEMALSLLQSDPQKTSQAVRAYLSDSAQNSCGCPLWRWKFLLEQTLRIAESSPQAAEAFVSSGKNICLMLSDTETCGWVEKGLSVNRSQQELLNYFSGTSLSSQENRDKMVSGVSLKDYSNRLSIICEALLGKKIKIRPVTSLFGIQGLRDAPVNDGHSIFLPETVSSFDLLKLMTLHQALLMEQAETVQKSATDKKSLVELHLQADKGLLKELPGLWQEIKEHISSDIAEHYPYLSEVGQIAEQPWWGQILPELVRETLSTIEHFRDKACQEYENITPETAEKLLTAMMAEGERGSTALWSRFRELADNIEFASPDPEDLSGDVQSFSYSEWDTNLLDYKLEWCLVRQRPVKEDANEYVENILDNLSGIVKMVRRQFMKLKPERFRKLRAQPNGDDLDIDALVQAVLDRRSGSHFSDNIYIKRDKRIRDVAVLFLLDLSGSTQEMSGERRVIDIQKEAMVLMAEALDSLQDLNAIYAFNSEGRFRVNMFKVKEFHEPYEEEVKYRLGNLEPMGLTRMGAVIRHATKKIDSVSAAVKLLIILTDGRPYDVEYGNLSYAMEDTKKAIQEARKQRIHPFIITSDKKGTEYLRHIAPQTQSIVLPKVELLPGLLPAMYKRLTV